jgi:hypothetical protein
MTVLVINRGFLRTVLVINHGFLGALFMKTVVFCGQCSGLTGVNRGFLMTVLVINRGFLGALFMNNSGCLWTLFMIMNSWLPVVFCGQYEFMVNQCFSSTF